MEDGYEPDGKARLVLLPCSVYGTPLVVGLLEIPEDDGEVVQLFTFDCPTGDFHTAIRESEVREMFAREVIKRMRLLESGT